MVSRRQMLGATAILAGGSALLRAARAGAAQGDTKGSGWDASYHGAEPDPALAPGEPGKDYTPVVTPNGKSLKYKVVDGSRQAAGGARYGGHLVNGLHATSTRYNCLVIDAGLINLESQWGTSDTIYHREVNSGGPVWEQGPVWREQNPIRFAKNFRTPILLTVGENDCRVPLNQTLENWSVLQRMRVPSRLIVFPEENHWIQKGENSRFFYRELHAWLKKYLNNGD